MSGYQYLSEEGFRVDGRRASEMRKLDCSLGVFTQADGSAYVKQGNTVVLAAVYGPHEVRGGRVKALHDRAVVNCQFSAATFSTAERKRRPRGDTKSIEMTLHLQQTFEAALLTSLYPRCQIDVFVEVLQADGSLLSVAINAATMALVDAGIGMRDYVCACSAGFFNDTSLLDLNNLEESHKGTGLTVAILPKSERVVLVDMSSKIHSDHVSKTIEAAIKGCKDIHATFDAKIKERVGNLAALISTEN
ncbi:exosome complex component RRP41-like [Varroa jacobsoni]|uniref:Putative exosome complex component RRP41 n=1 Tax=Varroa destructor TaxID=109461 RepID=A0A7M7KK27_VARDE|nr:exosome complex component RRP41-like [Varroa destructor]XP_022662146.1 exosome complex component RRP41-like [Varroa destructor]XP_022662147.1 exosome complex component RRP41-like [Varroa destructor]XP_022694008.1 exosome complex component RRP41-like [Varroa jacobsoni]XP_022694009.1 exosome complex component RRP41-like [Varroa jacobsoni]